MVKQNLESNTLSLENKDAEIFLDYMDRDRTEEEQASYKEADEFYKRQCKL